MKTTAAATSKLIAAGLWLVTSHGAGAEPQAVDPQFNMFTNGTFEKGLDGWETQAWGAHAIVTRDDNVRHDGHPSIRIEQTQAADTALVQSVTFKAQTHYRLSGWIKTENVVKAKIDGAMEGDVGAMLGVMGGYRLTEFVKGVEDWKHVSMDIFYPSFQDPVKDPHKKVGAQLGFFKKWTTGTAWFADLSLVELDPGKAVAHAPSASPARPPTTPPASPSDLATMGDLVKANHDNLVTVIGNNGAGSGFIARMGAANYLITNARVAAHLQGATFKTLDGATISTGAPIVAVDHDIFCLPVAPGGKPLELMGDVGTNAAIGDDVAVLGNADGAGVTTAIKGKIIGIGPNLVETDAPFVPGNSGSPIVHLKTGRVIGVATYAVIKRYDPATMQAAKDPTVRRFGYRLDNVKTWQPANWNLFASQATEMESIEALSGDLEKLLTDLAEHHKFPRESYLSPVIKRPLELWLADRERSQSPSDRAMSEQNFVSRLKAACLSDVTAARPRMTYDYFQRNLADERRLRDSLVSALDIIFQANR